MKWIKYNLAALAIISFTSCLKSKNDLAGIRNDEGTIVTSITEQQYLNTDAQAVGYGFSIFSNFSFATPNEDVKFFGLHIAQPRKKKLSGPLLVKISMQPLAGFDALPAGAVTIPAEISVPASNAIAIDFPVKFAVNKSLLDPTAHYGARFTITEVNQGVYSELDHVVDVIINNAQGYNNSRTTGRYRWKYSIADPLNQYSIADNLRLVVLEENNTNRLDPFDFRAWARSPNNLSYRYLWSSNNANGINTAIFQPRYVLDATGTVTGIQNMSALPANLVSTSAQVLAPTAVTNITLDGGTHRFVYNSNDQRTMTVSYSFDLTTQINGVSQTRRVHVTEEFTYDAIQAFY